MAVVLIVNEESRNQVAEGSLPQGELADAPGSRAEVRSLVADTTRAVNSPDIAGHGAPANLSVPLLQPRTSRRDVGDRHGG